MNGAALGGTNGFAQDRAGLGFAKAALDLVEVGELAESPPAVGFDDVVVRSSHSRHDMTALLCGCEWFQMVRGTTLTVLGTTLTKKDPAKYLLKLK